MTRTLLPGVPRAWLVLGAAALLAACAGPPTRFYTLAPAAPAPSAAASSGPVVGLEPVDLPEYLDRPQIVTRPDPYRVRVADLDTWAEPLDALVTRVTAENLGRLLGSDDVVVLPQRRPVEPAYVVGTEVGRLDADAAGRAILNARWWVIDPGTGRQLRSGVARIEEPAEAPDDYASVAAAMSRALGRMSRDIATAIAGLADGASS